jgi:hypothetical protein
MEASSNSLSPLAAIRTVYPKLSKEGFLTYQHVLVIVDARVLRFGVPDKQIGAWFTFHTTIFNTYPTRAGRPEFPEVVGGCSSARSRSLIASRDNTIFTRIFCMSNSTRAMMCGFSHSSYCLLNMGPSRLPFEEGFNDPNTRPNESVHY